MSIYKLYVEDLNNYKINLIGEYKNYSYLIFKISNFESIYKKQGYSKYKFIVEDNEKIIYERKVV